MVTGSLAHKLNISLSCIVNLVEFNCDTFILLPFLVALAFLHVVRNNYLIKSLLSLVTYFLYSSRSFHEEFCIVL